MSENVQGTFVSEKISKIRWKHEDFEDATNFITGSWDDPVRLSSTHLTYLCIHRLCTILIIC